MFAGELSLTGELRPIRGALAIAQGTRAHGLARIVVPLARAREAALVEGIEVVAVELAARGGGRARRPRRGPAAPRAGAGAGRSGDPGAAGHERRPRARRAAAGDPRRRRRRPQPVPARAAGHRQDDDRAPGPVDPAAAHAARRRSRSRASTRSRACTRAAGWSRRARSARRTTRSRRPAWSAAARCRCRARSRSRTTACCSSTSSRSSRAPRSRRCASRWRTAASRSCAPSGVMLFPTRCMLVAASNPCPCGLGDHRCRCSAADLARHQRRLSGPLLDRIDVTIAVGRPAAKALRRAARARFAGPARAGGRRTRAATAPLRRPRRLLQRADDAAHGPRAGRAPPRARCACSTSSTTATASAPAATTASSASPAPRPTSRAPTSVGPEHVTAALAHRTDAAPNRVAA